MKRMNVSLPDMVKSRADNMIKEGNFSFFSETVGVGLRIVLGNYAHIAQLRRQSRSWKRIDTNSLEDEQLF